MPKISNHLFAIYHLHYKKEFGITKSTKQLVTNSADFSFTCNGDTCFTSLSLVTNKEKLPRTCSIYTTDIWNEREEEAKSLSFFLRLILANFFSLANYSLV